jgi:hypothetical protein
MADLRVSCENPFDNRRTRVNVTLFVDPDAEASWYDEDYLRRAIRRTYQAAGSAWWDARAVYKARSNPIILAPWFEVPVEEAGAFRTVRVPAGHEVVEIDESTARTAPRGYPPDASYALTDARRATVEDNLQAAFAPRGRLTDSDVETIHAALEAVYIGGFNGSSLRLHATSSRCSSIDLAWYGTGKIRLCPRYFSVGDDRAAQTLLEELMHQHAGVGHKTSSLLANADTYASYYREHYL